MVFIIYVFLVYFFFFLYIIGDLVDVSVCIVFVFWYFSIFGFDIVEVCLNFIRIVDLLVNGDIIDFDELIVYWFLGNILILICMYVKDYFIV